jgi:membrane protein YdbS with pleckstrin-like domain
MLEPYIVRGVDANGAPVVREISADSIAAAERLGRDAGIRVTGVVLASAGGASPRRAPDAADAASAGAEESVWTGTPSHWPNLWRYLLIITIPWAIWVSIVIATTRYTITSQRLRIVTGVLSRHTEEIELYRVRDTGISQSLLQRIVGIGTLTMQTTDASMPNVVLGNISDAHAVRETLRRIVERVRRVQKVREIEMT